MIAQQIVFKWPNTFIEILIIIVICLVSLWLCNWLTKRIVEAANKKPEQRNQNLAEDDEAPQFFQLPDNRRQAHRTKTLGGLLNSAAQIFIIVIGVFTILRTINVDVTPALASAGIGGLAIGFGAQSLIRDVISGAFLIFEDQYGVGDWITVGDLSGRVVNVALRITQIQDANGEIWYIRNGEIAKLGNRTQGWSSAIVEIPVAITEDPYRIMKLLQQMCDKLNADRGVELKLLKPASVLGLMRFDQSAAFYGIDIQTPGNQHWAAQREVRARALEIFSANDVAMPRTVITTSDAPPLRVADGDPIAQTPASNRPE